MSDELHAPADVDRRVILHIGWPRTATTSMQHQLRSWPNNAGRPWIGPAGEVNRAVVRVLRSHGVSGPVVDAVLDAAWHHRALPVVLSDEGFVGLPRAQHPTTVPDPAEVARSWSATSWPTTVVATLREPTSLLRSSYRFAIRVGYDRPYRDYLAMATTHLDLGQGALSFHHVLSAWEEVVGPGHVVVRWMEDYVGDHRAFWRELADAVSVPELARLADTPEVHLNGGTYNPLWMELVANRALVRLTRGATAESRRQTRRRYNRWIARWLPRSDRPVQLGCEDLEREVVTRLEHDLDRVCADFGTRRPYPQPDR